RASDVAQPRCGEVQGRLAVGKSPDHARASPDLAQNALERVVGADAPPVLLRKGVVGQRLLDRRFSKLGRLGEAQAAQLLNHSDGLFARRHDVLAGMDRLEHGRDLPDFRRGHVAEDVAIPVHDAALPGRLGEELGRALAQPQAGVRDDQPDAGEAALLEVLEERAPARFVLLGPLADAQNLPIARAVYPDRYQKRHVANLAGPAALEHDAVQVEAPRHEGTDGARRSVAISAEVTIPRQVIGLSTELAYS